MHKKTSTTSIRLNKYIANSGLCSRREADMHISLGTVKVNGKTVTQMGYQVQQGDDVRFDGQRINPDKPTYVLLNKPKGFLAAVKKGNYKKDVMELVNQAAPFRIDPVTAMDRPATGLLLFTNDTILMQKLRDPNASLRKIYQLVLDKPIQQQDMDKMKAGVAIDPQLKLQVEEVSFIPKETKRVIGVEINTQTYKALHLIMKKLGYAIEHLDLVSYAHLTKRDLPRGRWRHLSIQEINLLKMLK